MAITKINTPELFDLGTTNSSLRLPSGDTASRPSNPNRGEWRYNTDDNYVEYWDGNAWFQIDYEAAAPTCTTNTINYPSGTTNTAYYKMEDATDQTGNYNGTATNVNFNVAGKFGNAGEFNGSSSYINIGTVLPITDSDASVSCWINIDSGFTSGNRTILGAASSTSGTEGALRILLSYVSANTYKITVAKSVGTTLYYSASFTNSSLNTGQFYNITVTYNATGRVAKTYVNGVLKDTVSLTATASITSASNVLIGGQRNNLALWLGKIDQVRIFPSALTSNQVTQLYNEVQCVPAIIPSDYFNPVIYTGDGTSGGNTKNITSVGFEPDFVWIKNRDVAVNHYLYDSIRGTGAATALHSNTTDSEASGSAYSVNGGVSAFLSNGFTAYRGTDNTYQGTNMNGQDYVAWSWKAGGAAVSNTNGDNNSAMVSANPDAGFSIITYTGDNANNSSVGHGLNQAPEMYIIKRTSSTSDWFIVHKDVNNYQAYLKFTSGTATNDTNMNAPTDSVIRFNTSSPTFNGSSQDWLIYAFHSVDGMSDIGSYVGTGATGNNIVTGFRPAFVMWKAAIRPSGGGSWYMYDNKRTASNPQGQYLQANESLQEFDGTSVFNMDFNSNGFTINATNNEINQSGSTYIFLAIAEEVYNANAVTANQTNPFNDGSQIAQYEFEDNADDSQPNGYIGKGGTFNGSSSVVNLPAYFSNPNTNSSTLSIWFKSNINDGNLRTIFANRNVSGGAAYDIYTINGILRFAHEGNLGGAGVVNGTTTVTDGNWHHIAVVLDNTTGVLNIYLDGNTSSAEITLNFTANSSLNLFGLTSYIGSTLFAERYFNGSIDQVRIYNTALNPNDVWLLYNETSATSSTLDYPASTGAVALYELEGDATSTSSSTYDGAATNVAWVPLYDGNDGGTVTYAAPSVSAPFLKAGVFNGSSSIMYVNGFDTTTNFSISLWFKSSASSYQVLANNGGSEGGKTGFNWWLTPSGKIQLVTSSGGGNYNGTPSSLSYNDGDWHNAVLNYASNGVYSIYVDNQSVVSETSSLYTGGAVASRPFAIGAWSQLNQYWFNGSLDQVRIFNKALDAGEILQLYNEPNN